MKARGAALEKGIEVKTAWIALMTADPGAA